MQHLLDGVLASQWHILKQAAIKWWDDNALRLSASLSYYTLFSLAPMLIIVIAVAGMIFGQAAVEGRLMDEITGLVGPESAHAIQSMIQHARESETDTTATSLGFIAMIVLSTGVFVELQDALNLIWRIRSPETTSFWHMLKGRLFSFCLIIGIGFLMIVSLTLSAAVAALGRFFTARLPGPEFLIHLVSAAVSLVVFTALFGMMFKILPDAHIAWRDVWIGALVTALLFTIGKMGIGLYLGKTGIASSYGAASSLAVILLWVYYSALILFFGAEYTYMSAKMSHAHLDAQSGNASRDDPGRRTS
ncbi:MAG TPA: YihY/virulence factor BrkB family protein [Nitrospiraceae bacterium]|nr:YihY/virulence factor BrkB family protein [Nitrospiraceae bacterium]